MPAHKNDHIWVTHGLRLKGMDLADLALPVMMEAVKRLASPEFASIVFKEALFQVYELPKLTPEARSRLEWKK